MPRTAKKSDTPGIVSLFHKQVFQAFVPKQSHRTPSPEKGAMVVDVGDVEKALRMVGRISVTAHLFFLIAPQQQQKLLTCSLFLHNASLAVEAAEGFAPGQWSDRAPAVQEAETPKRKDWRRGAESESTQHCIASDSRPIQPL